MSCSLQSFWRANLLLCLGLFLHCGEARVLTEAPVGPLYRVVGYPLTISCNVSGFASASRQQDFEFRVRKPSKPTFEINIISTRDPSFGYAVYRPRVRAAEITLTRLSPTSVVFEIQRLEKGDEGEFDCAVVNSESTYRGTYSASTAVKVIDNSLSVSSPASTSLSYNEGDALTLTCQASSNTVQHTHLSLAWYLHKDGEDNPQSIISLDRDFKLSPGTGFEGRYHAGLIRLDKMGETTYQLNIAQLELSDQGKIYCEAKEWVQDPDRSWYIIAQKDAEKTTVNVKAREVVTDTSSLAVRIAAEPTTLQKGQELSLSCTVSSQNLQEKFFSVAWLRGGFELARIGPTGILSVGPEYRVRAQQGELRAARSADADYRLTLQPVRTEDQGEYTCRAWPQERRHDGTFTQGAGQNSSPQLVSISATESGLSLEMQTAVKVNEGDRLSLTCKVLGFEGQISVTWQHKATSASTDVFTSVVSLNQEGVMEKAREFLSREVKATRPAADTFTLELDEVTPSDSGVYQCAVSEWRMNSKTRSQSQTTAVTVDPVESLVKTNLMSRNNIVTVGRDVELRCRVKGPRVPITVTWTLQRGSDIDNILTTQADGSISWSGDKHRYQLKVANQPNEITYFLIINGVTHMEAGSYQCSVSVFLQNIHKKLTPSNTLAVKVDDPVSKLALTSIRALPSEINKDIEIKCSVTSEPSVNARYSVTWLLQQKEEKKIIVSSDQDALVIFGPRMEPSRIQRISMKRSKGPSFDLGIRQAQISDIGSYICKVVEWIQDPRGDWHQFSPVSTTTNVTVMEPANDLRLDKTEQSLSATEGEEVEFKCDILGASSPPFSYKVSWHYTGHDSPDTDVLVELDHMGLLRYPGSQGVRGLQGRLRLSRPTQSSFYLGIQRAHEGDSGTYKCQVEQYQLDVDGQWQQKASESGGNIVLTVNVAANDLRLDKTEQSLSATEGDEVQFKCDFLGASSPPFSYKVAWHYTGHNSPNTDVLVELDHMGLLRYPENQGVRGLQGRLRLSRPTESSFYLGIQRAHEGDSGTYKCQVEQYQLDVDGQWQQKVLESGGNIMLTVNVAGKNLSIAKEEVAWNVSTSQRFAIPCHITKQSSSESEFQVTWFWQKDAENKHSIFTAYRNSTLEDRFGKGDRLQFSHRLPNHFNLTVVSPAPEDSGLYYCEVEEWLLSLSHGWRKVAVEKSGYSTVNVYAHGDHKAISEPGCMANTWVGILAAIVVCTLLIIVILLMMLCRSRGGKKPAQSLWAQPEQLPMNTKPSVED